MHKFLTLHLQFFAADGGTAGGGSTDGGDAAATDKGGDSTDGSDTSWIDSLYADDDAKTEPAATETKEEESMIPKKRFDSVNSKYKELSSNSEKLTGEYEKLQGDYSALEAAHKAADERVHSLEKVLVSMVDAELEEIDESYHDLIPTDKSVEEKLDWIRKAKAKGMFGSGSGSYEIEIGGMSNPGSAAARGRQTQGLNPLQLMQMGYGSK